MGTVNWTHQAVDDLKAVHDFTARDASTYAELLMETLLELAEELGEDPTKGQPMPEAEEKGILEIAHGAWRLFYRTVEEGVEILAVAPGIRAAADPAS